MRIEPEIKILMAEIRLRIQKIRWLRRHRAKLELAPDGRFCGEYLDFDYLPHKRTIEVVRTIGGKWKKTPAICEHLSNKIDYTTELEGVKVRVYAGDPPPSCRIVEVEELIPEQVIPAHVKKVRKMVCQPELSAVIATARKEPLA